MLYKFEEVLTQKMEEVSNRFPSLVHMILENVDNESLVKFKETSREMSEFLINDRFYWIRILKKHGKYFKEFADSWKKVIDKTPVKIVKELAMTVEDFFNYSLYNEDDYQFHPLHISMTSLLTHTVANATRPSFMPKANNQALENFLSLAIS